MEIPKEYIVDEQGNVTKVVVDYELFKKIEDLILDIGLAKAMEEVEDDEELSIDEAKKVLFSI